MNLQSLQYPIQRLPGAVDSSYMIHGLRDVDYHAAKHLQSCSMLKNMLESPGHYRHALFAKFKSSPEKDFGTAFHTLLLEPSTFASRISVYPGVKTNEKDFKDFKALHSGTIIIDEPTLLLLRLAVERLLEQRVRGRPFGDFVSEGEKEVSLFYTDTATGVQCRTRIDLRHPEADFDLKSTSFPQLRAWSNHSVQLHYDMQAYMYLLAECHFTGSSVPKPFYFMTIESDYPLSTSARMAGDDYLVNGMKKYEHAISAYAACAKTDYWPTPGGEEIVNIEPWQVANFESSWKMSA